MGRWDVGVWNDKVPLPKGITIKSLQTAFEATEVAIDRINKTFKENGLRPFFEIVQSNNFSGIISNVLTNQIGLVTSYSGGSERRGADLFSRKHGETLEVKTTLKVGKGGEGHNGHGGWHLIACYQVDDEGAIRFVHVMVANLIAFSGEPGDWARSGGTHHSGGAKTGHTETYGTTVEGTGKLRDGTVYRDKAVVDDKQIARWLHKRKLVALAVPIPPYSPFYAPPST
jgi:hypothetical protein